MTLPILNNYGYRTKCERYKPENKHTMKNYGQVTESM